MLCRGIRPAPVPKKRTGLSCLKALIVPKGLPWTTSRLTRTSGPSCPLGRNNSWRKNATNLMIYPQVTATNLPKVVNLTTGDRIAVCSPASMREGECLTLMRPALRFLMDNSACP